MLASAPFCLRRLAPPPAALPLVAFSSFFAKIDMAHLRRFRSSDRGRCVENVHAYAVSHCPMMMSAAAAAALHVYHFAAPDIDAESRDKRGVPPKRHDTQRQRRAFPLCAPSMPPSSKAMLFAQMRVC